jgi:hypothetical protein
MNRSWFMGSDRSLVRKGRTLFLELDGEEIYERRNYARSQTEKHDPLPGIPSLATAILPP